MLCLCPNCHVRFDGGTYVPTDDLTVVDTVEDRPEVKLKPHQWHYINPAYVRHHRHRSTSRNPHLLWWGDGFDAVIGDGCISTSAGEFLRRLAGVGRLTIAPISRGFGHSRFQLHFTPTYSPWINQVERWFAELERRCLERGVFCSLDELKAALENWVKVWNDRARPFKDQDRRPDPRPDLPLLLSRLRTGSLDA